MRSKFIVLFVLLSGSSVLAADDCESKWVDYWKSQKVGAMTKYKISEEISRGGGSSIKYRTSTILVANDNVVESREVIEGNDRRESIFKNTKKRFITACKNSQGQPEPVVVERGKAIVKVPAGEFECEWTRTELELTFSKRTVTEYISKTSGGPLKVKLHELEAGNDRSIETTTELVKYSN